MLHYILFLHLTSHLAASSLWFASFKRQQTFIFIRGNKVLLVKGTTAGFWFQLESSSSARGDWVSEWGAKVFCNQTELLVMLK